MPMTKRQQEVLEAVEKYESQREAARQLGISESSLRVTLARAREWQNADPAIVAMAERLGAEAPSVVHSGWHKEEGYSIYVYQGQARHDPADMIVAGVEAALEKWKGRAPDIEPPKVVDDDKCVVYPRADFHIGMLAWGRESGEDWDLQIAVNELSEGASYLVSAAPPAHTAVILGLGDFFHIDDERNKTPTNGHDLSADSRYAKIIETGLWLEIAKIKLALERHQEVYYKCLPGNHDPHSYFALQLAIRSYFDGHERVHVDDSPAARWYFRWGACLNGATHGHRVKQKELPMLMANERAKDWAECPFRTFWTGHYHHAKLLFVDGVWCRQVSSPAPKDNYAAAGPYVTERSMFAQVQHRTRGFLGTIEWPL